jgi:hypothetical protein
MTITLTAGNNNGSESMMKASQVVPTITCTSSILAGGVVNFTFSGFQGSVGIAWQYGSQTVSADSSGNGTGSFTVSTSTPSGNYDLIATDSSGVVKSTTFNVANNISTFIMNITDDGTAGGFVSMEYGSGPFTGQEIQLGTGVPTGTQVIIQAFANTGYSFSAWTPNATALKYLGGQTAGPLALIVKNENITLIGNFTKNSTPPPDAPPPNNPPPPPVTGWTYTQPNGTTTYVGVGQPYYIDPWGWLWFE